MNHRFENIFHLSSIYIEGVSPTMFPQTMSFTNWRSPVILDSCFSYLVHNRLPPRSGDSFSSSLALASFRSSAFALNGVAVMARDVSAQLEPKILWGQNWILNSVECTDPGSRKWKQDQSTGWQPVPWNYLFENLSFNFFGGVYKKNGTSKNF